MKRKCERCGEEYDADSRNVKRGWGLCCSKSCAAKMREQKKMLNNNYKVMNYIEITRKQIVRVPIRENANIRECMYVIEHSEMFDIDAFDWEKEDVIEEDYGAQTAKICVDGEIEVLTIKN